MRPPPLEQQPLEYPQGVAHPRGALALAPLYDRARVLVSYEGPHLGVQRLQLALQEEVDPGVRVGDRHELDRVEVDVASPPVLVAHEAAEVAGVSRRAVEKRGLRRWRGGGGCGGERGG